MSYELSFEKKTAWLMAGCLVVAGLLIFFAGMLLGLKSGVVGSSPIHVAESGTKAKLPAVKVPSSLSTGETKTSPKPSAPNPTAALGPVSNGAASSPSKSYGQSKRARASTAVHNFHIYCLQFGSFQQKDHATKLVKTLKKSGVSAEIIILRSSNDRKWFTVRTGHFPSIDQASEHEKELKIKTGIHSLVRRAGIL